MGLDLPFVIAHRGASGAAPENSRAAAIKVRTLRCRWIEVDLQLTADDVPVVTDDHTPQRMMNGDGAVAAATVAQLSVLDAEQWFAPTVESDLMPNCC